MEERIARELTVAKYSTWYCIITTYSNRVEIVRFGPKKTITALKRVHLVKMSMYIYSAKNFLPYPMWDITNTLPSKYNVLVVSYEIVGSNRQTPLIGPNKPPHGDPRSILIPFIMARIEYERKFLALYICKGSS